VHEVDLHRPGIADHREPEQHAAPPPAAAFARSAPAIVPLDDASREHLIAFVRETEPSGSTALAPAMRTAFVMNATRVVLLSDGLGNVGGWPGGDAA
jgi:hypothetical protein